MILVVLLTVLAICGTTQTLAKADLQNQCGTDYCVATPTPCDQGGGTLLDQNYVLIIPYYLGIKDPGSVYIYYKDDLQSLTYHGQVDNKSDGDYVYGISTKWAYVHPGWDEASNWEAYFETSLPPQ